MRTLNVLTGRWFLMLRKKPHCAGHFLNNLVTELSKPPNHCCLMKLPSVCFCELHENHDITSFSPFSLGEKNKSFISIYISRTSEPTSHTPIILHRARCWMCVPWVSPQLSPKDRPHGPPELSPSIPEADEIIVFWGKSTGKPGIFMPQILAGFRCRCFWHPLGRCEPILGCLLQAGHRMIWYDGFRAKLFQAKIEAGYQINSNNIYHIDPFGNVVKCKGSPFYYPVCRDCSFEIIPTDITSGHLIDENRWII